jgi:cysteine dioxygenase
VSSPTPPAKLAPLIHYLVQLTARAPIEQLRELLEATEVTLDDMRDFVEFAPDHYQRNLVCMGEWYEILVICWLSGQRSPIHNHAQSTCGLKVLSGVCSETVFDHAPCGQVVALHTHHATAGHICASQDADTHQVSNLQRSGENLVTLHIYSPPLRAMQRFSITGGTDVWRPPIVELAHGGGI